ncbi:MAG: hypothetical protein J5993_05310 [Clostridia bacterium]|nr:hypothetical protein [Clostridia bacterium]
MKILFLGDSITEAGRDPMNEKDLGSGFVQIFAGKLRLLYPEIQFEFINRGVTGYGVADVLEHTDEALALAPDIVVLLVGINDVTCRFTRGVEVTPDKFRACYGEIVDKILASGARPVILQPFVLKVPDKMRYRRFFDPFLQIVDEIVEQHDLLHVPLDGYFNGLCASNPASAYSQDGIHPTHRASRLIADNLIKNIKPYIK